MNLVLGDFIGDDMTGGGNVLCTSCADNHATPKNSKHQKRVRHVTRHGSHCDKVVLVDSKYLVYVHTYTCANVDGY